MRIFDNFQAAGHYHATMRWKTREKIIFFHDSKNLDSNKLAETQTVQYLTFIWK